MRGSKHLQALALAVASLGAVSLWSAASSAQTIEEMRKRDRRSLPPAELSAWTDFSRRVSQDPTSSADLRAETAFRLAIAHYHDKQYQAGWDAMEESVRIMPAGFPFESERAAYQSLLLTDLERYDEALVHAQRAIALARVNAGEHSAEIVAPYLAFGMLDYAKGNYIAAAQSMCLGSDRAKAHLPPSDSVVAGSMLACGIFRYNLDDDDAWEIMREAATIAYANLPRDHTVVAMALNGSGGVLMQLGRYAEAEDIIRREIDVERQVYGKDSINVYYPLSLLARLQELQGNLEDAEATFRQAADFINRVNHEGSNPELRGNSWVNLGLVLEKRGDFAGALAMQKRAVAQLRQQVEPGHESIPQAERHIARLQSIMGETEAALTLAQTSAQQLVKALGPNHRATIGAQIDYARALDRAGRTEDAFTVARDAIALLETRQLDLASKRSDMVSFSQVSARGFNDFAYIALRAGRYAEAVQAAQMASLSELSLVNAEVAANAQGRNRGLSDLISALRQNRMSERTLQSALAEAEGTGTGDPRAIGQQLEKTRQAIAQLNTQITEQFPSFGALSRPAPVALPAIQERLNNEDALLIPLSLPDRHVTIAITAQGVFWGEGDGSNRSIAADVTAVRRSIDAALTDPDAGAKSFDTRAANALYRALLPGALEQAVTSKTTWLFPANGPFANLSPALLLTSQPTRLAPMHRYPWLIRRHAVSVFSDFQAMRKPVGDTAGSRFVGVGAPDPDATAYRMPALPRAKQELLALSATLGRPDDNLVLAGDEATESRVKSIDFSRYAVAAFATHGLTSGERNGLREPALLLSRGSEPAENGDDGLLTASEIAALNIPAQWVVLSACNSGAGRDSSAPTYSGLARAFRLAGAQALLVSHWPVRDDAAARLTVGSLKGTTEGLSRSQSLRAAMLALMADRSVAHAAHPAIWAPFMLIEN